jgi:uncharacterized ferredoxin-like protein
MAVRVNTEAEALEQIADLMCVAARTAPKACGIDHIVTAVLSGPPDKQLVAAELRRIATEHNAPFFARDADNLEACGPAVLIGVTAERMHIPACDLCHFAGCEENEKAEARCAFNLIDLGIALGSAAGIAADHRVDCRIMYTVGLAANRLGLLGPDVAVAQAIPLSATGKNIFFDRK